MNLPELIWDPIERCAALAQPGSLEEARAAPSALLALQPGFAADPRRYLDCYMMQDELVDHVLEGLRRRSQGFRSSRRRVAPDLPRFAPVSSGAPSSPTIEAGVAWGPLSRSGAVLGGAPWCSMGLPEFART
jgi:hypothetical protein